MAFTINTNIASLQSQEYLRVNQDFQMKTINRVTSGLRIVNSADDAAGVSIANSIRSDRADTRVEGYFQSDEAAQPNADGFSVTWRVPFVARGMEKAADLSSFDLGLAAGRDMAVSFVASDDIYQGVARARAGGHSLSVRQLLLPIT